MLNNSNIMKINYVRVILIILCLSLVFFLLSSNKEPFLDNVITNPETVIENIIPLVRQTISENENTNQGYLITVVNTNPSKFNASHLYKIFTLRNLESSNNYMPLRNSKIDNQSIIVDLNWYHDELDNNDISTGKKLMCIALKRNNNMEPEYTIYIKETSDITSKWVKFNDLYSKNIKSIIYDLRDNMIGIDYNENQIYQLDTTLNKWFGPVNYDKNVRIHKLFFDVTKHMMCISIDGNLYRKESIDWITSEWKQVTLQKPSLNIYDIVHDTDGKIIALVDSRSKQNKQDDPKNNIFLRKQIDHDSNFVNYFEHIKPIKLENKKLTNNDVFMLKTGIDTDKFDYLSLNSTNMDKEEKKRKLITMVNLNHYLKFKRKLLNKCKHYRHSFSKEKQQPINISQNTPIINTIDTLIQKLDKN